MPSSPAVEPSTAALVLFGDWFAPHRASFWLGELIEALERVGVNPRSTRTVAQRFANAGWFEVERVGRRSRYRLTASGRSELGRGDARILHGPRPRGGGWTLVSIDPAGVDPVVGKALRWLGLGELRRDLWLSPHPPDEHLRAVLVDRSHQVFVDARVEGDDRTIVERCWDLRPAEVAYEAFLAAHGATSTTLDDAAAFVERFHLNHDFLLAVREDPQLPADLLAPDWPGTAARRLFERRREELDDGARRHLTDLAGQHDELAARSPSAA